MSDHVEVSVDETKNPNTPEPEKKEPTKVEAPDIKAELENYKKDMEKKLNASFYTQRKIEEQLGEISKKLTPQQRPSNPEVPKDEWDEKMQKDWKGTIFEMAEKRAEATYQKLREKELQEEKDRSEKSKREKLLNENMRKVLERHPELDEMDSDKTVLYRQIVEANPDYTTNPFGPVLAMRDMEDRLRSEGKWIDEPTKKVVEKEVIRQTRTNGTQTPQGTRTNTKTVTLSKDEREYCDRHNMKYEEFAKMKAITNRSMKDGVSA